MTNDGRVYSEEETSEIMQQWRSEEEEGDESENGTAAEWEEEEEEEEEDESEVIYQYAECPACYLDDNLPMGIIGWYLVYRCRACGAEYQNKIERAS